MLRYVGNGSSPRTSREVCVVWMFVQEAARTVWGADREAKKDSGLLQEALNFHTKASQGMSWLTYY